MHSHSFDVSFKCNPLRVSVFKLTRVLLFSAKGRTNVELREQFVLASGVSQSMAGFKSKPQAAQAPSANSSVSGEGRNGVSGPITKVSRDEP